MIYGLRSTLMSPRLSRRASFTAAGSPILHVLFQVMQTNVVVAQCVCPNISIDYDFYRHS
jgi:hypothetical protein